MTYSVPSFFAPRRTNKYRCMDGHRENDDSRVYWTLGRIREGIRRFEQEFGHTPSATEFDIVTYLPSYRHIYGSFGGIGNLRRLLNIDTQDRRAGAFRSALARTLGRRGLAAERIVRLNLEKQFGEAFVHAERKIEKGAWKTVRVDFFVFAPGGNFAVDVLTANNSVTLHSHLYIKLKKYQGIHFPIYFVVVHEALGGSELQKTLPQRLASLLTDIRRVMTLQEFLRNIQKLEAYRGMQ